MEDPKLVYLICDCIGLVLYILLYYCLYYTYNVNWLTSKATRVGVPRWTIIIVIASLIIPPFCVGVSLVSWVVYAFIVYNEGYTVDVPILKFLGGSLYDTDIKASKKDTEA